MDERAMAKSYAGGRVAIGVLMLLFPARSMRAFLGPGTRGTKAVTRMLAARDVVLGAGTLVALQDGKAPVRPWITYSAVCDAVDAAAMLLAYRQLPRWKRFGMLLLAVSGAGTGGYLVTRLED